MTNPWLRVYRPAARPRVRLVCFPHAGGTANFFRPWAAALPSDVELHAVCYPGRQERLSEPPAEDMATLADAITEAIPAGPVALFGHSMGASVAYEVCHRLESAGTRPARLFVSGRIAPHLTPPGPVPERDDEQLLAEVRALGFEGTASLDDADLREVVLPPLRADYRLIDGYRPAAPPKIATPVIGYTGISDPGCPVPAIRAWGELTTGGLQTRVFPGGHFYLMAAQAELLHHLVSNLR
ncbi:thioesterase II family protein [Longispora albida]|uniref:thioesterase II family protein n=1 Tax=Longispora albida TaxID=203523 RepID=UPI000685DFBA|nr:alpha/beta fold hydrolase [Longispora albida]